MLDLHLKGIDHVTFDIARLCSLSSLSSLKKKQTRKTIRHLALCLMPASKYKTPVRLAEYTRDGWFKV